MDVGRYASGRGTARSSLSHGRSGALSRRRTNPDQLSLFSALPAVTLSKGGDEVNLPESACVNPVPGAASDPSEGAPKLGLIAPVTTALDRAGSAKSATPLSRVASPSPVASPDQPELTAISGERTLTTSCSPDSSSAPSFVTAEHVKEEPSDAVDKNFGGCKAVESSPQEREMDAPRELTEIPDRMPIRRKRGRPPYPVLPSDRTLTAAAEEVTREVWFRALNDQTQGDQPPLRMFWKLAEYEGVNVSHLDLKEAILAVLLKKHGLHNNLERYARQMLICLERLLEVHPQIFSMVGYEVMVDTSIQHLPEANMPDGLLQDIDAWILIAPVQAENAINVSGALSPATIESYVRNVKTIVAALALSGIRVDPTVDVDFLIQPTCVLRWLKFVMRTAEDSTARGLVAALLRMSRDLPNKDPAHIRYLEARLEALMKHSLAMDGHKLAAAARWTEPEKYRCLLTAPQDLMAEAENKTLRYETRLLAGASAFAFVLMWEHCSIRPKEIAYFDLEHHVTGQPGSRCVLRHDPANSSNSQAQAQVAEELGPEAEQFYERLKAVRASMSVSNTLLLPGDDGRVREVRAAMEVIYNKIQGVIGERLTSSKLRDINTLAAMDGGADVDEVAAGAGYKHVRSLKRRLGVAADNKPGCGGSRG